MIENEYIVLKLQTTKLEAVIKSEMKQKTEFSGYVGLHVQYVESCVRS